RANPPGWASPRWSWTRAVLRSLPPPPTADIITVQLPADSIGLARAKNHVLVATATEVFRVSGAGLTALRLHAEHDEPATHGTIVALAARDDGAFVVSEGGLLHSWEDRLLWSPLGALFSGQTIFDVAATGAGDSEVVWIAADDGVHEISTDTWRRWDIATEAPISAITPGYGLADGVVVDFELGGVLRPSLGTVRSLRRSGDVVWFAADQGLTRSGEAWTQWTLGGTPANAVNAGLALAGDLVVDVQAGAQIAQGLNGRDLTQDRFGNVWVLGQAEVHGVMVGNGPTFADDVAPVLQSRCAYCHAAGVIAPKHDLTDYQTVVALWDSVLSRVTTGQMPPDDVPGLEDDELQALLAWVEGGLQP
ncbi:MAG: hypothetical protein ACI9WU_002734, partial [Myxococcota bacterium]